MEDFAGSAGAAGARRLPVGVLGAAPARMLLPSAPILLIAISIYAAVPDPTPGRGSLGPGPPEFQISTCFQNLITFLPRRTPFWSVILKATKLQSPL